MTATLRIVLDQPLADTDPGSVSRELARALIRTAPHDCEVAAIVPAGTDVEAVAGRVSGLAGVHKTTFARRELSASWQLGAGGGIGGGMIHSPSLMAPLVRHDRMHDNDQTVVTLWDLRAWDRPETLGRNAVMWHRAMLKRAEKHADAIVVPTHATATRLAGMGKFGRRIRVIAGAAPLGFAVPSDAVGRRRTLAIPEGTVVVAGPADAADGFAAVAAGGADLPVVVLDVPEDERGTIADQAAARGVGESRLHLCGRLDDADRAAVLDGALALVAPSRRTGFPWRGVEALALGVPVVASASPDHDEVLADGAVTAPDAAAMGDALAGALSSSAALERLAVLAGYRGRAFSWLEHADRVWGLHAEL